MRGRSRRRRNNRYARNGTTAGERGASAPCCRREANRDRDRDGDRDRVFSPRRLHHSASGPYTLSTALIPAARFPMTILSRAPLVLCVVLLACPSSQAKPPATLPKTKPLTMKGDIASQLVAGVDKF